MEVTLKLDQWDIQSELTFLVDESKFTEEKAKEVNDFWSNEGERLSACGTNVRAALKLYAVECFRLAGPNGFFAECIERQFDWDQGKGIEGFPSFNEAGLKLKRIESWGIGFEHVEFTGE